MAESRVVDQGVVVEVAKRILDGRCSCLLNSGVCLLEMRPDRSGIQWRRSGE
jgi:hypothetical protein